MNIADWEELRVELSAHRARLAEMVTEYNNIAQRVLEAREAENSLFSLVGNRIPADIKPDKDIPTLDPKNKNFKSRLGKMLSGRTNIERIEAMEAEIPLFAEDVKSLSNKIAKMRKRLVMDTGAEQMAAKVLVGKLEKSLASLNDGLLMCMKKFFEARHAALNRILGATEKIAKVFDDCPWMKSEALDELVYKNEENDFSPDLLTIDEKMIKGAI